MNDKIVPAGPFTNAIRDIIREIEAMMEATVCRCQFPSFTLPGADFINAGYK